MPRSSSPRVQQASQSRAVLHANGFANPTWHGHGLPVGQFSRRVHQTKQALNSQCVTRYGTVPERWRSDSQIERAVCRRLVERDMETCLEEKRVTGSQASIVFQTARRRMSSPRRVGANQTTDHACGGPVSSQGDRPRHAMAREALPCSTTHLKHRKDSAGIHSSLLGGYSEYPMPGSVRKVCSFGQAVPQWPRHTRHGRKVKRRRERIRPKRAVQGVLQIASVRGCRENGSPPTCFRSCWLHSSSMP